MSDLQKTIEILFQGKDSVSPAIDSIGKNMDSMGDNLQDIGAPFEDAVEKALLLEAAVLAIAAAGLKVRFDFEQEATRMSNALGLPIEKAEEFEEVAQRVYSSGFGGTIEESFSAVTIAAQRFSDVSAEGLGEMITDANKVKATFGTGVSESLAAVRTLMDNFGLSSKQAFDFITAGYQEGLNGSGDFLESVNEYSTQFANGGADAGYFFSVLETGFQEGIIGTDAAADAFKEFNDRILSNSNSTQEALESIGIDPEALQANLATGQITVAEAFTTINQHISSASDEATAFTAGAELMGEPFIKMGQDAVAAIDTTKTSLDDLAGKIDEINPDQSLGTKFTSMMNTIVMTITSDDIWQGIENDLKVRFDGFKDNFVAAWEGLSDSDFRPLLDSFDALVASIAGILDSADIDLSSVEGIQNAIKDVMDTIESLNSTTTGIVEVISPLVGLISDLVREFNDLSPSSKELAGNIAAFGAALGTVGGLVSAGGYLISGISTFAGLFSSSGALATGLSTAIGLLTGPVGLTVALSTLAAGAVGFSFSNVYRELSDSEEYLQQSTDKLNTVNGLVDRLQLLSSDDYTIELRTAFEHEDWDAVNAELTRIENEEHTVSITSESDTRAFDIVEGRIAALPYEQRMDLYTILDDEGVVAAEAALNQLEQDRETELKVEAETEIAKAKIDSEFAAKEMELTLTANTEIALAEIDREIAQITASAETAQSAFEWSAKVDIAQVEAAADMSVAAFDNIGNSVVALTESTDGMFSSIIGNWDSLGLSDQWAFMDLLEEQQAQQELALQSQIALNEAQAAYLNAQAGRMNGGEAMITIDSSGLEPALELVMYNIIDKVSVKASQTVTDFWGLV